MALVRLIHVWDFVSFNTALRSSIYTKPATLLPELDTRMTALFLLALLSAVHSLPLASLDPVQLPIFERSHVKLLLGNPGQLVSFRLNYSLDEIQLHTDLSSSSQTYTEFGGSGTELFYLGDYGLRLPFRYSADRSEPTLLLSRPGPYGGTLGLGRYSPLWKYWRRVTYSPTGITLGAHDRYTQRQPGTLPPLLSHGRVSCELDSGMLTEMQVSAGHLDMYLPEAAFTEQPREIRYSAESDCTSDYRRMGIEGDCVNQHRLPVRQQGVYMLNQKHYSAVRRSHDGRLHLGQRFLEDFAWFCDWDADKLSITDSAYGMDSSFVSELCAILLILVLTVWLTMILGQPQDEWIFQITVCLELYGHLIATVGSFVLLSALEWGRFASNLLHGSSTLLSLFLVYAIYSSAIAAAVLIYRTVEFPLELPERTDRHQRNLERLYSHTELRLFLFLSSVLLGLWLCVLPSHSSGADLLYLLVFSTGLCISAAVLSLYSLWKRQRYAWFMLLHSALFWVFLVFANILPTTHILDWHDSGLLSTLFYLTALVVFPTLVIFGKLIIFTHSSAEAQKTLHSSVE